MSATEITCGTCKQTQVLPSTYVAKRLKVSKTGNLFCSSACAAIHRHKAARQIKGGAVPILCPVCNQTSMKQPWHVNQARRDGVTICCSKSCAKLRQDEIRRQISGASQWQRQMERAKLNRPLVKPSAIAKQFREWAAMTARQCHAGLLIRLEIVDELPRLFAQKRNCPPPLPTPHTIGIYRSPTVEQVLSDLQRWDERRTINALRASGPALYSALAAEHSGAAA